ncbi:MAG: hypothetical protein WBA31_04435, partial [Candidatus Dormiibacterota bacterium]
LKSSEAVYFPRVGLVSQDLMVRSRVEASLPFPLVMVEAGAPRLEGGFDLLLLDLNRDAADRLGWLAELAAPQASEVICFGPHTEMAELNPTAKAAGASRCVANSHLPETLQRWLRSWGGGPTERGEQAL